MSKQEKTSDSYIEALDKINFAIKYKSETLDLSNLGLNILPKAIESLVNLKSLNLANNILRSLPTEVCNLTELSWINLSNNKLESLPPKINLLSNLTRLNLSNNVLQSLPKEIGQLSRLELLYLKSNGLTSLPEEIGQLKNLTSLNLRDNLLNSLPNEIGQLSSLTSLSLRKNIITEVPLEIGRLHLLTSLHLRGNALQSVPKNIGQLSNLKTLDLAKNDLDNLPNSISQLSSLKFLDLTSNKLSEIPAEIVALKKLETLLLHENKFEIPAEILGEANWGNKGAQKILVYLLELQLGNQESKRLNETKMIVVGQGGVGKTSIVRRLINNTFDPQSPQTTGIDIDIHTLHLSRKQEYVQLNIWDFGGQEHMHATHQFFLTQRSIYLFILDARIDLDANKPDYWLNLIEQYGGDQVPIILVINKIDNNPVLQINEAALKRQYNIIEIIRTSCQDNVGFDSLRQTLITTLDTLPHVSDLIPASWFGVKQSLEIEKKTKDIIPIRRFEELCDQYNVSKSGRPTLLALLHDLGTVLNFYQDEANPALGETKILNPEWVTDGIYTIIISESISHNKGVLFRNQVSEILDSKRYRNYTEHEFILGMMEQFELAYPFDAKKQYLIPDLLPESEPNLSTFKGTLNFEYHYPHAIPPSVLSRFIVRQHEKIKDQETMLWRNGAVIEFEGIQALVRAESPSRKLTIAVQGESKTQRRELLAIVRSTFDSIHKSFAKLHVRAMVPIPDNLEATVSYKALLTHESDDIDKIYVEGLDSFVPVQPLLDGIDGPKSDRDIIDIIQTHFDATDLKLLLLKIGIDYENIFISDKGKPEFILELIRYLKRQGKMDSFLSEVKKSRPGIDQ